MPEKQIPSLLDALTIFLGGGVGGAVIAEAIRQIGSRDKTSAESRKLDAESEKLKAEAEAVLRGIVNEQIKTATQLMREDAERRDREIERLRIYQGRLWAYVETLRTALRSAGADVPPAPAFDHGDE